MIASSMTPTRQLADAFQQQDLEGIEAQKEQLSQLEQPLGQAMVSRLVEEHSQA